MASAVAVLVAVLAIGTLVSARQVPGEASFVQTNWQNGEYKTMAPTIGILAQACHDCEFLIPTHVAHFFVSLAAM